MSKLCIGFAICGSFCTFDKAKEQIRFLCDNGNTVVPVMSYNAYSTDTRFGKAHEHIAEIEEITGKKIISTITDAEPIGPKKMLDILVIEPCTGNTLAKLANGITDTPVTLAAKAHLRNNRPLLIAVSTNDALSSSAANIGKLLNTKNVYFVPMRQDDSKNKPRSVVADFTRTDDAIKSAIDGIQLQPVIF
ncbi:MAG: dipicolinate synthase subunit B [Ruminococcaceae bacterium]|nr:dipicolinate synthase subunit B [Oscillospiraceae bacterium]